MKEGCVNSRFLRSVFGGNDKKVIHAKLSAPQAVNLYSTLDIFSITFELPLTTGLEPDFVYKGQSTKLGFFRVVSMWVTVDQDVSIQCKGYSYRTLKKLPLLQFNNLNKEFDIADFEFDERNKTYFYTTTLGILVDNSTSPIVRKIRDPIMGDFEIPEVFINRNIMSLNVEISDSQLQITS
ncbi:unnamed protein product [Ambrosiozyma monospora]|uniref:Unnamed protein product n=1 Tax=Ambrosiozyma monospora TaxID=43982 RepID=A0A9W6Z6Y8_AMBMO|nr:unnamed protein product [Ambrosiozyma monospora]